MTEGKRRKIWSKYGGHCAYCGCPLKYREMTVDHLKPKSRKGSGKTTNLMPACQRCNTAKGADGLEMLRITLVWTSLTPGDLQTFDSVRRKARRYKLYFERV